MSVERLQKVLARAGVAARRKAEELISAGRVRVDGQVVTTLGTKVDPKKQRVELDGRPVLPERLCYGILHKPRGMVTTLRDPEGRPTALEILRQVGVRVVPVGRLDFNTSGALLFTNDGDFAQALSHARGNVPKVYAAKIQQRIEETDLARWADQIEIEGKLTRSAEVRILRREGDKTWLEVTLKEGKNRQVRRLGDHAGTPVVRLARLSHAGIDTTGLRPGQWRLLSTDELKALRQQYGVPQKIRGALGPEPGARATSGSAPRSPRSASGSASTRAASGAARQPRPGHSPRSTSGAPKGRRADGGERSARPQGSGRSPRAGSGDSTVSRQPSAGRGQSRAGAGRSHGSPPSGDRPGQLGRRATRTDRGSASSRPRQKRS